MSLSSSQQRPCVQALSIDNLLFARARWAGTRHAVTQGDGTVGVGTWWPKKVLPPSDVHIPGFSAICAAELGIRHSVATSNSSSLELRISRHPPRARHPHLTAPPLATPSCKVQLSFRHTEPTLYLPPRSTAKPTRWIEVKCYTTRMTSWCLFFLVNALLVLRQCPDASTSHYRAERTSTGRDCDTGVTQQFGNTQT